MGVGRCGRLLKSGSPQSPPTGGWLSWRVMARPRPVCKNIWGEIGDWHVTAAARIVPHPYLGISVSDFRKFKCTTPKNFLEYVLSQIFLSVWCPTHSLIVWETQSEDGHFRSKTAFGILSPILWAGLSQITMFSTHRIPAAVPVLKGRVND